MGWMYTQGKGIIKNNKIALDWYRKAAIQGNAIAQHNIGSLYECGTDIPRDYRLACKWFQKAALNGYESAKYKLALHYKEGTGVPMNLNRALLLLLATDHQNRASLLKEIHELIPEVQGNLALVFQFYINAENKEDPIVSSTLGFCHEYGIGTKKDLNKAIIYFEKSIEKGNFYCIRDLWNCHQENPSLVNLEYLLDWCRKWSMASNVEDRKEAILLQAEIYEEGMKSLSNALKCCQEALLIDPNNTALERKFNELLPLFSLKTEIQKANVLPDDIVGIVSEYAIHPLI